MSNNLDKLFKKALQNRECEPPAYIWAGVEKHLALQHRRRIVHLWGIRTASAAAVLFLCLTLWQLFSPEKMPESSPLYVYVPGEVVDPIEYEFQTEEDSSALFDSKPSIVKSAENIRPRLSLPELRKMQSSLLIADNYNPNIKSTHQNFIPLTSREAIENQESYRNLLNQTDRSLDTEKKDVKISVSGHFTPAFSSGTYSSSVRNTRGYSYSQDQMKGIMNAGGGMRLSITTNNKLFFQTGISYSRIGQRTTDSNTGSRIAAFSVDKQSPRVTTPLGNVETEHKAIAFRTAEAIVLNTMSENTEETLEQVFGSVEIPMYVRYLLYSGNKFSLGVTGGLNGGFIVSNKVYLESENGKELLGSTENIRKFNLSTDLSLGVEYPVTRKIKIMLEPGFRYYLQSLSRNERINFKPYTFTLSTGIGIEF